MSVILYDNIIHRLDIQDILKYKKTHKYFHKYFLDNENGIYKFLLKRDFCIDTTRNTEKGYTSKQINTLNFMLYKKALFFSSYENMYKFVYQNSIYDECAKKYVFISRVQSLLNVIEKNHKKIKVYLIVIYLYNYIIENVSQALSEEEKIKENFLKNCIDKLMEINTDINNNKNKFKNKKFIRKWNLWCPKTLEKLKTLYRISIRKKERKDEY